MRSLRIAAGSMDAAMSVKPVNRMLPGRTTKRLISLLNRQRFLEVLPDTMFDMPITDPRGHLDHLLFVLSHDSPEYRVEEANVDFLIEMPSSDIVDAEGSLVEVTTRCHDSIMQHRQLQLAEFGEDPVLVPSTDLSVLTISEHRKELQDYRFVLPEHVLLEALIDKVGFVRCADQHSFPVPKTSVLTIPSDAQKAADDLTFPVFMKPAVKTPDWEANTSLKTRQCPPEFGTACLAQESDNAAVAEQTAVFFQRLNYRGLGYIEFQRDRRTGKHLIIEPNIGRPTGRSAMAEACGVPLLLTMYCDAVGIPMAAVSRQNTSPEPIKWVHLRRDVQAGIRAWRRGEGSLLSWLRSLRGRKIFAAASRRDPHPFLAECRRYLLPLILRREPKWSCDVKAKYPLDKPASSERPIRSESVLTGKRLS